MKQPKEEQVQLTQRGVENPKVIDLIFTREDEVVLRMIEERTWRASPDQPQQLGEKFDNYLEYVLGGWLTKQYPQHEGKKICFELACREEPEGEVQQMITDMKEFAVTRGFTFETTPLAESSSGEG